MAPEEEAVPLPAEEAAEVLLKEKEKNDVKEEREVRAGWKWRIWGCSRRYLTGY